MKRLAIKEQNGFTLMEVIISIFLLGLIATMALSSFQGVADQQALSVDYNQATKVATSQVELIQELANTNRYDQINDRDIDQAGFRIEWDVSDFTMDNSGNLQPTSPANSELKQIEIRVTSLVDGRIFVTRIIRISSRT